jgi:hypothetical protein
MMLAAQWHGELVADFAAQRARLRKFQVVRVARRAVAEEEPPRAAEAVQRVPPDSFTCSAMKRARVDPPSRTKSYLPTRTQPKINKLLVFRKTNPILFFYSKYLGLGHLLGFRSVALEAPSPSSGPFL